jgi:hypothetical protein
MREAKRNNGPGVRYQRKQTMSERPIFVQFVANSLSGWRLWLAAGLGFAVLALLIVFAFVIFLVALPIVAIVMTMRAWRARREMSRDVAPADPPIIETEYVVMDETKERLPRP